MLMHFSLGMEHGEFILLVGRLVPGFQDGPIRDDPKPKSEPRRLLILFLQVGEIC